MVSFRGQKKAWAPPRSVSFTGLIQNFRRASPPLSYAESPPPPGDYAICTSALSRYPVCETFGASKKYKKMTKSFLSLLEDNTECSPGRSALENRTYILVVTISRIPDRKTKIPSSRRGQIIFVNPASRVACCSSENETP